MSDLSVHYKLDDILGQLTDLTTANTAMLGGLVNLTASIDTLRELTAQLLDSVTDEEGGELEEEISKLVAAVNNMADGITQLGIAIPARLEEIVLANGGAIPAP